MGHRGAFFWGGILILVGILLFLNNMGWLAVDVWKVILPSLVILLGLMTLWAATRPREPLAEQSLQLPLEGAASAKVRVRFGAGRLTLAGGAGAASVVEGSFRGGVEHNLHRSGQELGLELRGPSDFFLNFLSPWTWWTGHRLEWDARLNETVPLGLDIETGASDTRLDLSRLRVEKLRLSLGASSVEATMPSAAGRTNARIESGAASLTIHIPTGVAARIEMESGLSSARVDPSRFPKVGKIYQSLDYDTAANRLDLRIEAGLASVEVR
jgi:Domain of unknown function (DUF5668)/N-terminal domain of toast_rack, DUF2154